MNQQPVLNPEAASFGMTDFTNHWMANAASQMAYQQPPYMQYAQMNPAFAQQIAN